MSTSQIQDVYPLSPTQQGILFHTLYAPAAGMYVEQLTCALHGELNATAFARAWQLLLDRHTILRSAFVWKDLAQPVQVVGRRVALPLTQHDWRSLTDAEQQIRLADCRVADRRPFDLATAPLMRLTLVRLTERDYRLIWSHHHLLLDGWSITLVLNELFACYAALCQGRAPVLAAPRPYRDYIAWLQRQDLTQAEAFWRQTLHGLTAATALLGAHPTDQAAAPALIASTAISLAAPATTALQAFSRRHGLTLNTLVQGAWALLLSRYSGEQDVVFGTTVAGRPPELPDVARMVGLFINTLPLRVRLAGGTATLDWLQQLQDQQLAMRKYEHSPLVQIQSWSAIPRGQPLFESIVIFENYPISTAGRDQDGQAALTIRDIHMEEQNNYALALLALPGARLTLRIMYDRQRFDDALIRRLLSHLQMLLVALSAQPQRRLAELPLLTAAERAQLLVEWNDTVAGVRGQGSGVGSFTTDACLHELFATQAERTPDAIALVWNDQQISYRALNARANQLAHYLQARGVGPEVLVGICLERSPALLIALLGVHKAGGAYLPLDPTYPQERLAFMLADSQARVLITQQGMDDGRWTMDEERQPESLHDLGLTIDVLHASPAAIVNRQSEIVNPDNLAYLIYTSGSTGQPKGVAITQRALVNALATLRQQPGMTRQDVLLAVTTIAFDIAGLELLLPLLCGARVELIPRTVATDGRQLAAQLVSRRATIMQATPATWQLLAAAGWPGSVQLKILCGGEALPRDLADQLLTRSAALWNLYGPTETTIWSAIARITAAGLVSIGRPIANTQIYLLDAHMQPVPIGVAGEVFIGGLGLARGYHRRPDLTAEKFIPNPFAALTPAAAAAPPLPRTGEGAGGEGTRLYRTGDLARYRADGSIEYLGRRDHQVKIRGYRIELGEIEMVLAQHAHVRSSVVLAREDAPGDKRLVAYVVSSADDRPSTIDDKMLPAGLSIVHRPSPIVQELRDFLATRLPSFMIPSAFVLLDTLPLTSNGKIDRRALPAPDATRAEQTYVLPRTPIEQVLANIWADVLNLERVSVDDNFFDLGGHSLHVLQVGARLHEIFAIELPLQAFFEAPTIADLAERIELSGRAAGSDATMLAQVFLKVDQLSEEEVKAMLSEIG